MKKYIFKNKFLLLLTLLTGAIYSIISTSIAFILRELMDVSAARNKDAFFSMIAITIIYIVVLFLFYLLYSTLSKKFIGKVICGLRYDVFNGVFKKNIQDFKSVNSADYISALTNDVKLVEDNYLIPLLLSLNNIVIFITAFLIIIYLNPIIILCIIVAALLLFAVPSIFKDKLKERQDLFSKRLSRLTIAVKDFLSGFEVIRSYRMNDYVIQSFKAENDDTYKTKYFMDRVVARLEAASTTLGMVVQFSILFVSSYLIIRGNITVGMLMALVNLSGAMITPIQVLSQNISKIQGTKLVVNRLKGFIDSTNTVFSGTEIPSFNSQIVVQGLRFGYENTHCIIKGIDFVFEQNKKYALVGKSGCGKTTLINLLTGCHFGYEGQISYDGKDIRELDIEKLNEMSAVIHQNTYMFDTSIKDNICLHKQVSEQDLTYALNISGVQMFLDDTKSLDTMVGENGSNISGGQRQRIAVARALVQKKSMLILDEGTSAVDMQTAYDIESQLLHNENLTLITITHSLNSELLKAYDCIIFMEEGQIREYGTFTELVDAKESFFDFYNVKSVTHVL